MACSSVNCASYCYSYGCGSIHRGARPSYSYPFPDVGVESNAAFTNALRSAVASELAARQVGHGVASANVVTGTHDVAVVNGVQVLTDLRDCINAMVYCIGTVYTGDIYQWHVTEIRDRIQGLMRDCVCNSDCGANAWCTCYGDCGCNYSSDERLKKDIKPLDISEVAAGFDKLKPVEFKYKERVRKHTYEYRWGMGSSETSDRTHYGFLAQQLREVFPELVGEDETGLYLNAPSMIGLLSAALKETRDELRGLKEEVAQLRANKANKVNRENKAKGTKTKPEQENCEDPEVQAILKTLFYRVDYKGVNEEGVGYSQDTTPVTFDTIPRRDEPILLIVDDPSDYAIDFYSAYVTAENRNHKDPLNGWDLRFLSSERLGTKAFIETMNNIIVLAKSAGRTPYYAPPQG